MKLIKSTVLFDGAEEKENMIIGFEGDEIKYVGSRKPDEGRGTEMILEGDVSFYFIKACRLVATKQMMEKFHLVT
jgi:hypothetical protein